MVTAVGKGSYQVSALYRIEVRTKTIANTGGKPGSLK